MIGKLISLDGKPQRNVEVTITPNMLSSEISKPRSAVSPFEVRGLIIEKRRWWFRNLIRLWLQTNGGDIEFYQSHSMFDVALILDEMEAAIGSRPRILKNIKEAELVAETDGKPSV